VSLVAFDGKNRGRLGRVLIRSWLGYRAVKKIKPAICHLHDPEILWVGLVLKWHGVKVIFDAHEDYEKKVLSRYWVPKFLSPVISFSYKKVSKVMIKRFDAAIGATDLISSLQPNQKRCTLHNYPRLDELSSSTGDSVRESNRILYTGGLTSHRGIEQVVKALCEVSSGNWKLVIVGQENPEVAKRLKCYLQDPRIDYRGVVAFEEVKSLLDESRIGVVCNQRGYDYENALPNKLFEYMAAGLAVICSNFESWKEIVEDTGSGYTCDTTDIKVLGETLDYVLGNPELAIKCGENGKVAIKNRYSWEREERKLIALYEEVLNGDF